jgi:hypothetical protein
VTYMAFPVITNLGQLCKYEDCTMEYVLDYVSASVRDACGFLYKYSTGLVPPYLFTLTGSPRTKDNPFFAVSRPSEAQVALISSV